MFELEDQFRRKFAYIRLSITNRCNFSCEYCLPNGYQKSIYDKTDLNLNEIRNLITALIELGIWKIRLTGGEPTIRRDFLEIIQLIATFTKLKQIAVTTNGYKLLDKVTQYKNAGITNLNVSVDSLYKERFLRITKVDKLDYILSGIEQALKLGFNKVKINVVLLNDLTLAELELFVEYIKFRPISIRFIELMQTGENFIYFKQKHISAKFVEDHLLTNGWDKIVREVGAGPAQEYANSKYLGTIGIIAPYSKDFCATCNRLRITQCGELRLCLFSDNNLSLRDLLQSPSQKDELKQSIIQALLGKKASHQLLEQKTGSTTNFSSIGG